MAKLLIFDFDGVIINSRAVAEEKLSSLYPKLTPDMHKKLMEGNFHEELEKFKQLHGYKDLEGEAAEKHNIEYTNKKLAAPLFEGVSELLKQLHTEGYTLVLNTSAWQRNCVPMLEKNNLSHVFDFLA